METNSRFNAIQVQGIHLLGKDETNFLKNCQNVELRKFNRQVKMLGWRESSHRL